MSDIIVNFEPTSGGCDVVILCLLRDMVDVIEPSITSVINSSLPNGVVPMVLEQAVVQPPL